MKTPENSSLSDGALLLLSRKRDEEAFLALYRRHQDPVFRFALHMSGSVEIAEEVTQEVFLVLLADLQGYAPESGPLQAYLIGIARNRVRRQMRTRQRARSAPDERQLPAALDLHEDVSHAQELGALREAVLRLPANYREVVVLCDLEGLEYAEAATRLGCAIGTVRSRLHRARRLLQSKLVKNARHAGCTA